MQSLDLITIKDASVWASTHLGKEVSTSNISYLIQYGRIQRFAENGSVFVSKNELENYYSAQYDTRKKVWKEILGEDLNWSLSFEQYKEAETTKHVHRLHPYKGKFIPQLVEYFLDDHTDRFKTDVFFKKNDIVLDPFLGSGTTIVQANELGLHAIGVDVSAFNIMISAVKIGKYNLAALKKELNTISSLLAQNPYTQKSKTFDNRLLAELNTFNSEHFPVPDYKYRIRNKLLDENTYAYQKADEFLPIYQKLINEFEIDLLADKPQNFLEEWFFIPIRQEIDLVFQYVRKIKEPDLKRILAIILSRTIRSCRATTHADLATLNKPISTTYYCAKHGKICKPLFSIQKWWNSYSKDTLKRIREFDALRTNTWQACIAGDSRSIDILAELKKINPEFADLLSTQKIKGIFSSPPYVGMIDYHEQHAYAYDLFGFERKDELEIGPLFRGQGKDAQNSYVEGISKVLLNAKPLLQDDYDVFLVSNDKYNLYPEIAHLAGMKIVNQYKRPVLNRTEKDKNAYSEIIFHFKEV